MKLIRFKTVCVFIVFFLILITGFLLYRDILIKNEIELNLIRSKLTLTRLALDLTRSKLPKTQHMPIPEDEVILLTKVNFPIIVDRRDGVVANELISNGLWEKQVNLALGKLIKPNDLIVEIGANYGYYTILMSKLIGNHGKLISYEANPLVCRLLNKNIILNNLSNVDMKCVAVSDKIGTVKFLHGFSNLGGAFIVPNAMNTKQFKVEPDYKDWQEITVPTTTLAQDLPENKNIDVLRIDAEGSELPILKGAWNLITRSKAIKIVMEWDVTMMSRFGNVSSLLADLENEGFRFYLINQDGDFVAKTKQEMLKLPHSDVVITRHNLEERLISACTNPQDTQWWTSNCPIFKEAGKKKYFSQYLEDYILSIVFSGIKQGTYIDVGAFHPHIDSVTNIFYLQGWHGINVEPMKDRIDFFQMSRPRDINLGVGISNQNGTLKFNEQSELSTFSRKYIRTTGKNFSYDVPVLTLNTVLEQFPLKSIDFIKIDVEGFEKEVLEGLDLKKHRPKVFIIEAIDPIYHFASHQAWENILLQQDYLLVMFDGLNRYYLAKENKSFLDGFFTARNCACHPEIIMHNFSGSNLYFNKELKQLE